MLWASLCILCLLYNQSVNNMILRMILVSTVLMLSIGCGSSDPNDKNKLKDVPQSELEVGE